LRSCEHAEIVLVQSGCRNNKPAPGGVGIAHYDSFKLQNDWKSLPTGDAGRVTHEDYWERITYFLEKIIPAAKENDVQFRLAAFRSLDQFESEGYGSYSKLFQAAGEGVTK
jgi:hypothetical protein